MARPLPCFVGFSIGRARSNPDPGALQSIDGAGALLGIAAPGARLCLARFQPLNNLGAGVERVRHGLDEQIGRASCRERVCQYVSISVVGVALNNTIILYYKNIS